MGSVTKRIRRSITWRRELAPVACFHCGTRAVLRYDGRLWCGTYGCLEGLPSHEPIVYDPSDGSTKGVRG